MHCCVEGLALQCLSLLVVANFKVLTFFALYFVLTDHTTNAFTSTVLAVV